ncbi:hypothetical protein LTR84_009103 [Exophiala bonariae]|uniref:Thioredoxin domain-containing protein n=1 Tax=Exophiala bonariae TaxID=1690606 RepID=A0AAV9MVH5_9EURO|nr:hypothetical protein LTR84_009103 [Exophiala bonariae]
MVKEGDYIPDVDLFENSPRTKVNLAQELASGKGVIVGVPAAFSPSCSDKHVPGYLASGRLKDAGKIFIVSVNDAFVTKAWGKALDEHQSSGVRFLADPAGQFSKAWDVLFDATPALGNHRSKRYAITTQDGQVVKVSIEAEPGAVTVSGAAQHL